MTYLIYAPWEFSPVCGGHIALHKLAKNISDKGRDVIILEEPGFDCNAKVVKIFKGEVVDFELDSTVVVYPEIIEGNPLNAKHVVRWILYDVKEEVEATWADTDHYFYYLPRFKTIRNQDKNVLPVFNFEFDLEYSDKTEESCVLFRKKTPEVLTINAVKLEEPVSIADFCKQVSAFKRFYTYDDCTFYLVIAALCRCVSIILNPSMDAQTFRNENPLLMYGVAYGDSEEEINRAMQSAAMIPDLLKQFEQQSMQHLNNFIKHFENI